MERRALVALTTVLMLAGCSQPAGTALSEQGATAQAVGRVELPSLFHSPENLEELTNTVRKATYIIQCGDSYGSGYGYSPYWYEERQNFIITTHTVISQCLELGTDPEITNSEWESFGAKIVSSKVQEGVPLEFTENIDLAILRPKATGVESLEKVAARTQTGSWVMTGSYPLINDGLLTYAVTHGIVAANTYNLGYATTAVTNPGSNGGVVVNSRGELLGTLYTPDTEIPAGIKYFLPFDQVVTLIEELREKTPARDAKPRLG